MIILVKKPTIKLIQKIANESKNRPKDSSEEKALNSLIGKHPDNKDLAAIIIKVATVNSLYHTHIYNAYQVAKVIQQSNFSDLIRKGDSEAVEKIATAEGKRNYSFATKYCYWHNRDAYPIYDMYVDYMLWEYKKNGDLAKFYRKDLRVYRRFKEIMNEFRCRFGLEQLSIYDVDIFLWSEGKRIMPKRKTKN